MTQASQGYVIDTPEGIQAYRHIATVHGLKMEIDMPKLYGFPPTACPTRGMALGTAKAILAEHGKYVPGRNITRKEALKRMKALCKELGYAGY